MRPLFVIIAAAVGFLIGTLTARTERRAPTAPARLSAPLTLPTLGGTAQEAP